MPKAKATEAPAEAAAPVKKPAAKAPAKPKAPKVAKPKAPREEGAVAEAVERGRRKLREGIVVSNKMDKTVVVNVTRRTQHPIYGKVVIRSKKFKAHDIVGCDEGDRVEIMECRPISREKRWRVVQILEKVK